VRDLYPPTLSKAGRSETQRRISGVIWCAAGEAAECGFWIGLAVDERFTPLSAAQPILADYGKLGFMIRKLWKEWKKL
jgi:hypothetical protein